jgi:hypothetical protein
VFENMKTQDTRFLLLILQFCLIYYIEEVTFIYVTFAYMQHV